MRRLTLLLSSFLLASAPAQAILRVGPGQQFAEIGPAILAAASGDVIEVATGNYAPFTLDRALTIVATPASMVQVLPRLLGGNTELRPPAGTTARIVGLRFLNPWPAFLMHETSVTSGTVWLQDCVLEGPGPLQRNGLTVRNATVVLERCIVAGFGISNGQLAGDCNGLFAENATVTAVDSRFGGSNTGFDLSSAGAGLFVSNSRVHLVRCTADGGAGDWTCFYPAGAGIHSRNNSRLWLADCSLRGGARTCGTGGPGLDHQGAFAAELARCTLVGGPGATVGPGILGPVVTAPLLGLGATTMPLQIGQPYAVNWTTQPGWPAVVLAGQDLAAGIDPRLVQPALLPLAGVQTFALLVGDPLGLARLQITLPNAPALLYGAVWLQPVSGLAMPLQAAPAVGGVIR
ncbi:MAG: hypothetical protein IPK26_21960 [Planctomycetes bacterium]|nr:hypothetical protein [Planctomycetota bacterium]